MATITKLSLEGVEPITADVILASPGVEDGAVLTSDLS